jgi:hypothetical protein
MTTPEVSHVSADTEPESVHQDIGYSRPFVPGELTPGQARQLYSQHLGGKEAARIATRPESPLMKTPEESREAAYRWLDHNEPVVERLRNLRTVARARGDSFEVARLTASLDRRHKMQGEIIARIERLTAIIEPHEEE